MLKALAAVGAVAAASALLVPTASLASTVTSSGDGEVQTATVSYADLNLANPAGSNRLMGRMKVAASDLCGSARPVELAEIEANRICVSSALASAKPAFDAAVAAARGASVTVTVGASLILSAPRP
jgi:UrcA family protein